MRILSEPYFHDEAAAIAKLASLVWPHGPVCPHCGGGDQITVVGGRTARRAKQPASRSRRRSSRASQQDKAQSERFIQAAREHACERDEAAFDEALRKVFPPKGSSQSPTVRGIP